MSKYRLASSAFQRNEEGGIQEPLSVYFLSVEGNDTEVKYFRGVKSSKSAIGISALIDIEILNRRSKDTQSDPTKVIELLEEYIEIRGTDDEHIINELTEDFINKYSREFIQDYINNPQSIPKKQRNAFSYELQLLGYDIEYRRYLRKYNSEKDVFCIVIDRDKHSNVKECIQYCNEKKYKAYLTNPCFEFWLLLHLVDVKEKYKYEDLLENKKLTNTHSFVSKEVSELAGHGKKNICFEKNYLTNIDLAIQRANDYETDINSLHDKVGTNLGELILLLRK